MASSSRSAILARRRNDGQQDVRLTPRPAVDRHLLAEDVRRTIARVIVLERADAGEHRAERAEPGRRSARVLVVAPADRETEAVASGRNDRRRLDLDVDVVDLSGVQGPPFIVLA